MAEGKKDEALPWLEKGGPGAERVAALLMGLGAEAATALFQQMTEMEVRQIALGAKALKRMGTKAIPDSLKTFCDSMMQAGVDALGGDAMLRKMATELLGPDTVKRTFDAQPPTHQPEELLGVVATADPESLAMILAREQPQTIALVLSSLTAERAALVMDRLPLAMRPQVVRRMAVVEAVSPEVLREVRTALASELNSLVAEGMRRVDGRIAALEILRRSPATQQTEILASIERDDPNLANELRSKLFTFEDLTRLSDRDLQSLMKDLDMKQVTVALKGGSPELREKFLKNMSSRAGELLQDDLTAMGPVKLSEVEGAQAEIAKVAIEAAEKGRITIVRPTDKML
ncbi:MAG: FliG C-terminal domain-containing protein [Archangium sp.]|nr:FliG C-terminal domain-containing protein [Archangium sp.]